MPETHPDSTVLITLADALPDALLRDLFPARPPESIRGLLREIAGRQASRGATGEEIRHSPAAAGESQPPTLKQGAGNCILYADGASRGNPGEAGAGIVLLDADGREIESASFYLGRCTNNAAEYQALIAGLETAVRSGCRKVRIRLDSELIVRQINGRYKVRNEQLLPLYIRVNDLLARLAGWDIQHIPRSENARADKLANRGIDERRDRIGGGRMIAPAHAGEESPNTTGHGGS